MRVFCKLYRNYISYIAQAMTVGSTGTPGFIVEVMVALVT